MYEGEFRAGIQEGSVRPVLAILILYRVPTPGQMEVVILVFSKMENYTEEEDLSSVMAKLLKAILLMESLQMDYLGLEAYQRRGIQLVKTKQLPSTYELENRCGKMCSKK